MLKSQDTWPLTSFWMPVSAPPPLLKTVGLPASLHTLHTSWAAVLCQHCHPMARQCGTQCSPLPFSCPRKELWSPLPLYRFLLMISSAQFRQFRFDPHAALLLVESLLEITPPKRLICPSVSLSHLCVSPHPRDALLSSLWPGGLEDASDVGRDVISFRSSPHLPQPVINRLRTPSLTGRRPDPEETLKVFVEGMHCRALREAYTVSLPLGQGPVAWSWHPLPSPLHL